jgi:cytochrome c oxidase cbb3-type subunit 4
VDIYALFQSVWTIIVMVIFLGIVVWAYSNKHKASFDATAKSLIDDDDSVKAKEKKDV